MALTHTIFKNQRTPANRLGIDSKWQKHADRARILWKSRGTLNNPKNSKKTLQNSLKRWSLGLFTIYVMLSDSNTSQLKGVQFEYSFKLVWHHLPPAPIIYRLMIYLRKSFFAQLFYSQSFIEVYWNLNYPGKFIMQILNSQ